MIGMQLEAVDTLFFRDGTPFSAGSSSQDDVGGLFPPHALSIAGALRATLAKLNGWTGSGRWPQQLNATLGDGPDDLGMISFDGPFLLYNGQPLFSVPRHLLGCNENRRWQPRIFLRPGTPVACDIGDETPLPDIPPHDGDIEVADLKAGEGLWLTCRGIEDALCGKIPSPKELLSSEDLWCEERRIGIERNDISRSAQEGMLYSTRHIRPLRGVTLGVRVSGLPTTWTMPFGQLVSLGGESRFAECSEWQGEVNIEMPLEAIEATRRLLIVALTPVDLEKAICCGKQPLTALGNARVVSCCLNRAQRIGGWDSLSRSPLHLRSLLPAGSVLFCELAEPGLFHTSVKASDGLPRIGDRQRWGFGMVALGKWTDGSEVIP